MTDAIIGPQEIFVTGPPETIDINVDMGLPGTPGGLWFFGHGIPKTENLPKPPKTYDVYFDIDTNNIWQYIKFPNNQHEWEHVHDFAVDETIIVDAVLEWLEEHDLEGQISTAVQDYMTENPGALGDLSDYLTTSAAPELIRDTMGTALVAGANVTITPNDAGDTITIAAPTLLGSYTHSGNLVAQPTAVDLETGVFTCVDHGLTTGNLVRPRFNGGFGNASLQDVLPGGLTVVNLTVTVLTPDTFIVGPTQFTSEGDLSVWAFERFVTANRTVHRVNLPEPVSSCRVVAYGIDGTRYIGAETLITGVNNSWTVGELVVDRYGTLGLNQNTEVGFFCEYTARNIGGLQALFGLKVRINANGVLTVDGPTMALSRIAQPLAVTWVSFDNGRVYNGNTLEVWDR